MITDIEILESALAHFESRCQELRRQISAIRSPGARPTSLAAEAEASPTAPTKKRTMSAAARKRIAAAQKKRWAEFHAEKKTAAPAKKKTPMSAARKKALAENLAKAREARAAKRKAAS